MRDFRGKKKKKEEEVIRMSYAKAHSLRTLCGQLSRSSFSWHFFFFFKAQEFPLLPALVMKLTTCSWLVVCSSWTADGKAKRTKVKENASLSSKSPQMNNRVYLHLNGKWDLRALAVNQIYSDNLKNTCIRYNDFHSIENHLVQNTDSSLVIAVSVRFNRTDRDAFWIPSGWVGRAVKEKAALTSQRHSPSPGSLRLPKS